MKPEATDEQIFEATLHKTRQWLSEVAAGLEDDDIQLAYNALRAVLHALRDRLSVEEAAHLASELPLLVRGIYYEGWRPAGKPLKMDRDEFLDAIRRELIKGIRQFEPEHAARQVFAVLAKHVSAGEIADVRGVLPAELRELWG